MINKKMIKRLSAFALSALLLVSACPSNAFFATEAAENTLTDETIIPNDETGIPDTVLYKYLINTTVYGSAGSTIADSNGDGKLSVGEAKDISYLRVELKEGEKIATFKNIGNYLDVDMFYFTDGNEESMTVFTEADIDEFAKMNNLSDFTIYDAKVEGTASISKLTEIRMLNLGRNGITNVDFVTKENFPNLTDLYLSGNPIQTVPSSIMEMTELEGLDLSNCSLTGSFDVSGFTNLGNLYISRNELTEIKGLDRLIKLTRLSIDGNKLTEIPTLEYMTQLQDLYIGENELVEIPGLDKLINLEYISASGNKFKTLPDLSALTKLKYLYVSNNELESLPDMQGLTSLTDLLLNGNMLTILPNMKGLGITYFNIKENLLTEEEIIAKVPELYATDENWVKETVKGQRKGIEATFTTDVTEIEQGDKVTVNLTFKNVGGTVKDLFVKVTENGKPYFPIDNTYSTTENSVCIDSLGYGESVTFTYEVTMTDSRDWMYLNAEIKTEDYSVYWNDWKEISVKPETLELKVKDVTVSNSNVVVNNDAPTVKVDVAISVEGAGIDKLQDGSYADVYLLNTENKEAGNFAVQVYYNAETKKFEGTANLYGTSWLDGQYVMVRMQYQGGAEIVCEKEIPMWTYTNNCTDKTAPVLNGVQVLINGVTQTGTTFKLKQGDTITIRADITDDSSLVGGATIYPANWDNLSTSQYMEMSNAGNIAYTMYATEYDLEAEKTLNAPFYEGEYQLYYVVIQDGCVNQSVYLAEALSPLMKEVAKNPANAGLVENETLAADLDKVAGNIGTLVTKENAMDADTKANVEAAIAAGDTVSVDLTINNVPANSVNSKVKEEVQKNADDVFGENTKLIYLDINMTLVGAKTGTLGTLKELGEEISVTVTIPEELQGDYYYKVVRSHKNADDTIETTILDAVKNADGTLTFKTDRFSTYAIAYSTTAPKTPAIPQTGDNSMPLMYLAFAVAGMAALAVSGKTRKA